VYSAISSQCVFAYATRGHFIVARFEFTFRSYFRVCHCKIGRNTTVLAPGCRLETCTDSKPTSCKQEGQGLQRRCLPTAPSNKLQEKNSSAATLVFVLSCEIHIDLLSDCARVTRDDKAPLLRTASLFLRHPTKSTTKRVFVNRETTSDMSVWTLSATGRTPCSCMCTTAAIFLAATERLR